MRIFAFAVSGALTTWLYYELGTGRQALPWIFLSAGAGGLAALHVVRRMQRRLERRDRHEAEM